ncbi:MAG: hypothetical protein AB7N65_04065 [Vicinamibacterales bacterium]
MFLGVGLILPLIAWTHRPLSLRNFGEATMLEMRGDWVFRPSYFYATFVLSAGLLIAGAARLLGRARR